MTMKPAATRASVIALAVPAGTARAGALVLGLVTLALQGRAHTKAIASGWAGLARRRRRG
jgi:hypothetical protein